MKVTRTYATGSTITTLTNNTGGSANDTLEAMADVGVDVILAADQSDVNDRLALLRNNVSDLGAKINALIDVLVSAGIISS